MLCPLRWLDALLKPLVDWLVALPKFMVGSPRGATPRTGRAAATPAASQASLVLRLQPTKTLWTWVVIGSVASSLALLPHWLASAASLLVGLLWVSLLLRRIGATTAGRRKLGDVAGGSMMVSPYAGRRRGIMVWTPVAVTFVLVGLLTLVWNLPEPFNLAAAKEPSVWPFAIFHACCGTLCLLYFVFHRLRASTLRLHGLEDWHGELPRPSQSRMRRMVSTTPRYPSMSWRHFPDMSWEVNSAGTSLGLFGDQDDRPIWRRSTQYVIWYFAPIAIPLFSLFATPLLQNALIGQASITDHIKLSLGVDVVVWLVWSVSYFVASGTQDFMVPSRARRRDHPPNSLVELLSYPNRELRRVAKEYFDGKGAAAFNLLALAVVPLYMGYVGLLPGGGGASAVESVCREREAGAPPPCVSPAGETGAGRSPPLVPARPASATNRPPSGGPG